MDKVKEFDPDIIETLKELFGSDGNIVEAIEGYYPASPLLRKLMQEKLSEHRVVTGSWNNYDKSKLEGEIRNWAKEDGVLNMVLEILESDTGEVILYKKSYKRLKELKDRGDSYSDLFTHISEDVDYLSEIFVRLVEETEGVVITSAKQLQELTDITEIYGHWEENGEERPTKTEAQEIAFKQIEDTFIEAMSYRYSTTLETLLKAGAKYNDLFQIKPQDYNLPETWSGRPAKDQYSSILWVIVFTFFYTNAGYKMPVRPNLRSIAQEIEAPYSIIMDAYKLIK